MDHPNIAKVLDAGATELGRPFFVMELVKGDPIVEYCDKNNLSIEDRLELFAQVCNAVQHAHTKGIIHRDIKPSNILVSTQDGRPNAKVIDFGIAKATASKLTEKTLFTEHKALIGTPEYMSPEQAEGSLDIDTRTDVYSLGVLLYELLTGTTPFSSKELRSAAYAEIQRIIREVEPPKPSTRLSSNTDTIASVAARRHTEPKRKLGTIVRGELDWIVMKALEKDRQRRYETANGLAMDIRRYLAGDAVLAAPPSAAYRFRKFVRRNRAQVAAAALIALALVLGMAGTAWQAKAASDQAAAARAAENEARLARDAEKARADELKQVSDFQEGLLAQIDPATAGVRLTEDVNRRFAAALEKLGVPEAERTPRADAFRQEWLHVNATDAALALIDETILKAAVKAIDEKFEDQPLVDAQLRQALAERYFKLGLYDAAYPLQESAVRTRRRVLGEEHPDTLVSISNKGLLLQSQGNYAGAEALFREALTALQATLPAGHPEIAAGLNNLAMALQEQNELAEAEALFRESLEIRRGAFPAGHSDIAVGLHGLAGVLQDQNKLPEAEALRREALEISRAALPAGHQDIAAGLNNLAVILLEQNKVAEAEPLLREALEIRRAALPAGHPAIASALNNLTWPLQDQGKFDEAEPLLREALGIRRAALPAGHPDIALALNNLAWMLMRQDKLAEAEPLFREALGIWRAALPAGHPRIAMTLDNLGKLKAALGDFVESESLQREGLAIRRAAFPEGHPEIAVGLNNLASCLLDQSRFLDAEPLLRESTAIFRATRPAGHPDRVICIANLATVYAKLRNVDKALLLLAEVLAEYRATLPKDSPELAWEFAMVAPSLLELKAWDEAEPLIRECLAIREKAEPDAWTTFNTKSLLGEALLGQKRYDEAESLLLDGFRGMKEREAAIPPQAATRLPEAAQRLVDLYTARGDDAKAAEWRATLEDHSTTLPSR
jgi:Tfp pilus assembly protein PilF